MDREEQIQPVTLNEAADLVGLVGSVDLLPD